MDWKDDRTEFERGSMEYINYYEDGFGNNMYTLKDKDTYVYVFKEEIYKYLTGYEDDEDNRDHDALEDRCHSGGCFT